MVNFILDIYSHHFTLTNVKDSYIDIITKLNDKCTLKGLIRSGNKDIYGNIRIYNSYAVHNGIEVYRYHISLLSTLRDLVRSYNLQPGEYTVIKHSLFTPKYINAPIKEGWVPRDYQVPVIDYLIQPDNISMVNLGTGLGKTSITLMAISKLKMKTLILIKKSYLDKWLFDVHNVLDIPKNRVNVIQGGPSLKRLIELVIEGKDESDIIIMSVSTFNNYIKLYEQFDEDIYNLGFGCKPHEFFEKCGIGVVLMDEVHQMYAMQFDAMLYMHTHKLIGLSATFFSKNRSLEKIYNIGFPYNMRYKETLNEKYINTIAVAYNFKEPKLIRTTEYGSNMYSQSAFEKSIIKKEDILVNYLRMITDMVNEGYIKRYIKGDKCAVFAYSKSMCILIRDALRNLYPELSIEKYTEEDPYSNAIDPDIRVSTIGSLGTAIDIPNLRSTYLTINIDSPVAVRQTIGRLRKLKDKEVYFYYMYCQQLDKHVKFHKNKQHTLSPVCKCFSEQIYPKSI